MVGFEDLEDKLPPSMTEEEQQRYNKAERKVLRAINYAFGYTWGAFLRNLVDLLTFLPLRRYAYVEEISERVYFAFNDLISWSHGVDHEVGGKGSIEDPDKPTYWSNNDVLCGEPHAGATASLPRDDAALSASKGPRH